MSDWNDKIIAEFHENNGVVGGPFTGAHLMLLTTTGAKSGEKRVTPVAHVIEGDTRIIVASKAGAPMNPHWYHNLLKDPRVHVEEATDSGIVEYDAIASVMPEEQRAVKYAEIAESRPAFAEYQIRTDRVIPLVVLTRVD
jgi:deazaflavin-dependent oxidoreductase (nitroreductase family)